MGVREAEGKGPVSMAWLAVVVLTMLALACQLVDPPCSDQDPGCGQTGPLTYVLLFGNLDCTAARYAAHVQSDSALAAYWRFEETSGSFATDSSAGIIGTLNGDATLGTDGLFPGSGDSALGLDGAGDYMVSSLVTTSTDNITVAFWAKWDGTLTSGSRMMVINGDSATNGFHVLLDSSAQLRVLLGGTGEMGAGFIFTPAWTYVAVTRDSGNWRAFVDGVEVPLTAQFAPATPTGVSGAGASNLGLETWGGVLDELTIYERAFSLADAQVAYGLGSCTL